MLLLIFYKQEIVVLTFTIYTFEHIFRSVTFCNDFLLYIQEKLTLSFQYELLIDMNYPKSKRIIGDEDVVETYSFLIHKL